MIQPPWQSTCTISQSLILGVQCLENNLYLFQRSLISIYDYHHQSITLLQEIHLPTTLKTYSINHYYIALLTEGSVEVRSKNCWEKVIFFMKNDGIQGIMLRDQTIIIEHVDQTKNYLQFINLTNNSSYEVELGPIFKGEAVRKLDKRLISLSNIGQMNDVYAYQSGSGTVQAGLLVQITPNKKKTFSTGNRQSLKCGSIKTIFRHKLKTNSRSYPTQLIGLIIQWEQQNSINLLFKQIIPSTHLPQLQDVDVESKIILEELDNILKTEQQQKQQQDKKIVEFKLFLQLIDNQLYQNSFYSQNVLWVSTARSIVRIQLDDTFTISNLANQIIKKVDKWTKNLPFIGILNQKPLFKDVQLVIPTLTQHKQSKAIGKKKQSASLQTQDVWVEDQQIQTKETISNIMIDVQTQSKLFRTVETQTTNHSYQNYNLQTQYYSKITQSQTQHKQTDEKSISCINQNNTLLIQTQTLQQIHNEVQTEKEMKQMAVQMISQINNQKKYVEMNSKTNYYCQTDKRNSVLEISCHSIQEMIKSQKLVKEPSFLNWQIQPIHHKGESLLDFGTITDINLIGLDHFPEDHLKQMNLQLVHFSRDLNEQFLKAIESLHQSNSKAKSQIEMTIQQVLKGFGKIQIANKLQILLQPIIQKSLNTLHSQTKIMFEEAFNIFNQRSFEILAINNTIQKQYDQGVSIIQQMKKVVFQFTSVLKTKKLNDIAIYNSMKNQIEYLKLEVQKLTKQLEDRIKEEAQNELKIKQGFQKITKVSKLLEDLALKQKTPQQSEEDEQYQDEQEEEEDIKQHIPNNKSGKVGTAVPSYYDMQYSYPYIQSNHLGGYQPQPVYYPPYINSQFHQPMIPPPNMMHHPMMYQPPKPQIPSKNKKNKTNKK